MNYIAAMTHRPHDCRVRIICTGPGAIGRQGAWTLWSATMDAEQSVPKSLIQMMDPPRPKCKRSCRTTSFPGACARSGTPEAGTRRRSSFPVAPTGADDNDEQAERQVDSDYL